MRSVSLHHRKFAGAVAALSMLAVAACGGSDSGGKSPYELTINTDLSGPFSASFGIGLSEGFQAYIAHVNESGGVAGHKIKLTLLDDRSDVQMGLANYQQALNSDSLGMFLDASTAVSGPVGAKATQDKFVYNAASYLGGVGVYPYVYGTVTNIDGYLPVLLKFAETKVPNPTGAKVALMQYDTPVQRTYTTKVVQGFKDKGWTIAYQQVVPQTTLDFSVAAGQIAAASPAYIIASLLDTQLPQFTSAIRLRGVTAPIITFATNPTDAVIKRINDPNFFVIRYSASPADTSIPAVVEMRQFAEKSGHIRGLDSNVFTLGYVVAQVVVAALNTCGDSCTRDSFNKALEQTTIDAKGLMAGRPGWSSASHVMAQSVAVTQVSAAGIGVPVSGFEFK